MIEFKIIEKLDEFSKLRQPWDELVAQTDCDLVFMRHLWFEEMARAYSLDGFLAVVTLWRDGQLAAVAPVYRNRQPFKGIRTKAISFIAGEPTPRCNFIAADVDLIEPLVGKMMNLSDWDILYLENMEEDAASTKRYLELLETDRYGSGFQSSEGLQSPFMTIRGSWDDYWNSLSKKRRKHLNKMCFRRLDKAASYRFKRIESGDEFEEFASNMIGISGKSWKSERGTHIQAESSEGRFYAGFTPKAMEQGLVAIYTIELNGRLAGFEYLLKSGCNYSATRCDFDQEFKYYSPGSNLKIAIIKHLSEMDGPCKYDLTGAAYQYKLEWCSEIRSHLTITVGNRNLKGRFVIMAKNSILPFVRRFSGRIFPIDDGMGPKS
jgi:CelD/BcsL family acetyltransferase involved in cellulose biosynthesis